MRVPCGRCGQLNELASGSDLSAQTVRCTGCGATFSLRRQSRPALTTRRVTAATAAAAPNPFRGSGTTSNWKKALVSLLVVGAFGAVVHPGGTFATFNATVTNPAAITTGTIVLSSVNPTSGTCLSVGAGTTITTTNSFNCATSFLAIPQSTLIPTLFSTTNLPIKGSANVITLSNVGSINATTVQLYAAGNCTAVAGAGTYKGANIGTSIGVCSAIDVVIYEATDATGATMATNGCLYGNKLSPGSTGPVVGCTFDKNTVAAPALGTQPAYQFTPSDFGTCHLLLGSGACAGGGSNGPITLLNTGGTNLVLTSASGNSAFIVIDVAFPDTGDQSVMGTVGTLNLTFQISQ